MAVTLTLAGIWWSLLGVGAASVLLGGAVVLASLWLYAAIFRAAILRGRRRLAITLTFVKLGALLGLGWLAFMAPGWSPDPWGFALGVTCLPVAAAWEARQVGRR